MHGTEEASRYKDIGGSARNTILALVRRTQPLIIGNTLSNQESHEQPRIPRTQITRPLTIQKGCQSFRPAIYETLNK